MKLLMIISLFIIATACDAECVKAEYLKPKLDEYWSKEGFAIEEYSNQVIIYYKAKSTSNKNEMNVIKSENDGYIIGDNGCMILLGYEKDIWKDMDKSIKNKTFKRGKWTINKTVHQVIAIGNEKLISDIKSKICDK